MNNNNGMRGLRAAAYALSAFAGALVLGLGLGFAGVLLIFAPWQQANSIASWGAVLCLGAALTYAVAVVAQKPLLTRVSGVQITFIACAIGTVACLPFAGQLVAEAAKK